MIVFRKPFKSEFKLRKHVMKAKR